MYAQQLFNSQLVGKNWHCRFFFALAYESCMLNALSHVGVICLIYFQLIPDPSSLMDGFSRKLIASWCPLIIHTLLTTRPNHQQYTTIAEGEVNSSGYVHVPRCKSSRYINISSAVHSDPDGDSKLLFQYLPNQLDKKGKVTFCKLKMSLGRNFVNNLQTFQGFCQGAFYNFVANSAWK